jgi:prophage antirepressor-like protein
VDGNPWFRAKEVATILAYTNTKKAIIDHVDDEDKKRRE